MTAPLCPVSHGFLSCAIPLLPQSTEDAVLWSAALDCFGQAASTAVETRRAQHVVEFAVKTCLPRAFDMFQLPLGRHVLSTLPPLNADTLPVMQEALKLLRHQKWNSGYAGEALMRESLLRPLDVALDALTLLESGRNAEVCATLEPVIERLSGTEELAPMLAALLRITSAHANGRPAFTQSAPMGLRFGAAG